MDELLKSLLVCPLCRGKLKFEPRKMTCYSCGQSYEISETGQAILMPPGKSDDFEKSQELIKQGSALHQFYLRHSGNWFLNLGRRILRKLVGGSFFVYLKRRERVLSTLFPENKKNLVVDIGAGGNPIHKNAITLDIYPETSSQIIAQTERLPFINDSLDGVVLCGVLEHLKQPWTIASELIRVLKPGGYLYVEVPLLQGVHLNPYDEQRFTPDGLETLFQPLITVEKGICSGPGSALAHILPNWLAMLFSFNSKFLFEILFLFFSWLTFPVKYTDVILLKHPYAYRAPFAVYYLGQKK